MSRRILQRVTTSAKLLAKGRHSAVEQTATSAGAAAQHLIPGLYVHQCMPHTSTATTTAWHSIQASPTPTSITQNDIEGVRAAEAGKDILEVTFNDGSIHHFPYCWLRDNCQCPQCFDSDALCRKLTLEDWQHDDCLTHVQVDKDGSQVWVKWASGHSSTYKAHWLQQHSFTPSARNSQRTFMALKKELWSTELEIPKMDYGAVKSGNKEMLEFLVTMEKTGVAVLTDTPKTTEAMLSMINNIGYVKPTHYGTHYPIRSKAGASSLAYTDLKLGMHNDLPYFQYVPGIIFLHCIIQFEGEGGENDLADGFQVAEYLRVHHPTEYRILADTPVYFWDKGVAQVKQETTEYHKITNIPIIMEDRLSGAVVRVNNSQLRNSYLDLPPDQVGPWYAALRLFNQTLDQHSVRNKLESGEMMVMDNTRLLHGRTAYNGAHGERHMDQAYLDWDGALSRRRVLQEKLGVTLE